MTLAHPGKPKEDSLDPYQKLTLRIQQLVSEGVYDEITLNIRTLEIVAKISKEREGLASPIRDDVPAK